MARYSVNEFVEVDKNMRDDVNMCWECSSCAALWASGWANSWIHYSVPGPPEAPDELVRQSFLSPTDVHNYSLRFINDVGGLGFWHMLWFISGSLPRSGKVYAEGGGGFYGLTSKEALSYIYNAPPEDVFQLMRKWENRNTKDGITASIHWGTSNAEPSDPEYTLQGGHEVPVWGYEKDEPNPGLFNLKVYPSPVGDDDPVRLSAIQISDPDDETTGRRFWLRACYFGNSHLYKLLPDPDDSNVPDNWKNKASIWLYGITLLKKKPVNLLPSYNLE